MKWIETPYSTMKTRNVIKILKRVEKIDVFFCVSVFSVCASYVEPTHSLKVVEGKK